MAFRFGTAVGAASIALGCALLPTTGVLAESRSADSGSRVRFQAGDLRSWYAELPGRMAGVEVHCPRPESCVAFLAVRGLREDELPKPEGARSESAERVAEPPKPRSEAVRSKWGVYRIALNDDPALLEVAKLPGAAYSETPVVPTLSILETGGESQLFVSWEGRGYLVRSGGLQEVIRQTEDAPWRSIRAFDPRASLLIAEDVGEMEVYWLEGDRVFQQTHALPVEVEPGFRGLRLRSPPVRLLRKKPPLYAVGPQVQGNIRLRTLLLDPLTPFPGQDPPTPLGGPDTPNIPDTTDDESDEPQEDSALTEVWSMLPGLERVESADFHWLDGRGILQVVTLRADKVGILERKKLRLFELEADRTRAGSRPFFQVLSASRLWQRLGVEMVEATGDQVLDLVLVQPEGLAGNKLAVDLFRGYREGDALRFEDKPLRAIVKEPEAFWSYGMDWTDDGLPDLLTMSDGRMRLFAGVPLHKKVFLSLQPSGEHQVHVAARSGTNDEGEEAEDGPSRRAQAFPQDQGGFVVVRSRYDQGNDLVEIVAPR